MDAGKVIELWEEQDFLDGLKKHSIRVAAMALFISDKFIEEGKKVDKELVKYGGLLHDIGKMHNIKGIDHKSHSDIGKEILLKKGYPKLASIAYEHFINFIVDRNFTLIESEMVAVADCLANPEGFVTFKRRMEYGKRANPQFIEVFIKGEKILKDYFKRLFDDEENFKKIISRLTEKLDFKNKTYKELIEDL